MRKIQVPAKDTDTPYPLFWQTFQAVPVTSFGFDPHGLDRFYQPPAPPKGSLPRRDRSLAAPAPRATRPAWIRGLPTDGRP